MIASIIGLGSFGTSMAQVISKNSKDVRLFGRDKFIIDSINHCRINKMYHPFIELNDTIRAYHLYNESQSLVESDLVIFCVPSGSIREVAHNLSTYLHETIILSTAKGIEYPSLKYMTSLIKEETKNLNVFSLSGPTFADELIRDVLSAATLGVDKPQFAQNISSLLRSPNLLIDYSNDVQGVELCGVLKNIYAVSMGIFDSLFYGYNEHYTFLNLCFKESKYVLNQLNHDDLIDKFCSFGDFNLTANADKSRNRTLGLMMGKNISLNSDESTITFESMKSARALKIMADNHKIKAPIIDFVNSTFEDHSDIRRKIMFLLDELKRSY